MNVLLTLENGRIAFKKVRIPRHNRRYPFRLDVDLDDIAPETQDLDAVYQGAAVRALRPEESPVDAVVAMEAIRGAKGERN